MNINKYLMVLCIVIILAINSTKSRALDNVYVHPTATFNSYGMITQGYGDYYDEIRTLRGEDNYEYAIDAPLSSLSTIGIGTYAEDEIYDVPIPGTSFGYRPP